MFSFGVDYYPEQWPEARWQEDARLMAEAGFNTIRLAEFAWSQLEPQQGQFDFAWLDRAIDLLAARDMRVVLGTPTASPPPWLMSRHPEFFLVRQDGRQASFGHRRGYCPNHPSYRDYAHSIVAHMAEHYADHSAVIGWQIDNEFGDRCYCPCCAEAFHNWLRVRYHTLDVLNKRWGTVFWSHVYTDWEQIPLPLSTGGQPNPGLALDFYRFCSESYVAFEQMQTDILRAACPRHFITHNFMGFSYDQLNYFDLARPLDFVAWDNYLRTQWNMCEPFDPTYAALGHDTMRGLKRRAFWVIEQQAGPAGWEIVGPAPRPGQLRLWAYQAIAHGADGILFFRWRTARTGAEQYWHGLLDHAGRLTRRYDEIRRMGVEIAKIGDRLVDTQPAPQVAILLSYDARFAFQIQANNPGFGYGSHFTEVYRVLHRLQVPVDIVEPDADLSQYRLVFAPTLHVVDESVSAKLQDYATGGGVLAVTLRSGVKDEANQVVDRPLPGLLTELCGVEVEEYDSLPPGKTNALRFNVPELAAEDLPVTEVWSDILRPCGAEVIATYVHDYYADRPAITLHHVGAGHVLYLGALGKQDLLLPLTRWLLGLADVEPGLKAGEGMEILERRHGERTVLFVLNHSDEEQTVPLDGIYHDLLDGLAVEGAVRVGPYDVHVLEKGK